ncbi:MAG: DUF4326 domain-containing protein [Paludibacter sp.]|nr:DUF4326 domain-containing protein [Bacteroidales bacterium]MCM1069807.1 DUF4326 domain-containing protein [Prevotella sp.]MCM1353999.1 DUF4326 domain-containing protein [Bacteroides sp.]MCM1443359.1 DUF4326 domain-containing protein [Muribaculum sp.]MCM1482062.1 DUF4326 domain-containing protein [Paludibacter sp.]
MIYIGNLHKGFEQTLRHGLVVCCDRGYSVLANPFKVSSEAERDESCNRYKDYFEEKVRTKTDTAFMNELRRVYLLALRQDIVLACWCYPKRCHTQTIKTFLESFMPPAAIKQITPSVSDWSGGRYKPPAKLPPLTVHLDAEEQKKLDWLTKKGVDEKKRKGIAYNFIHEWRFLLEGEMSARKFVQTQQNYCVKNYSYRFAHTFAFKTICVLDQVKSIEKRKDTSITQYLMCIVIGTPIHDIEPVYCFTTKKMLSIFCE